MLNEIIAQDIQFAQAHLEELPENARHGLTLDTLRQFGCGFFPNWTSPKSRADGKDFPESPRLIIPTNDAHYYAVDLGSTSARVTAGKIAVFNARAIDASKTIIAVRNPLDVMAIAQAVPSVPAVAFTGHNGADLLVDALKGGKYTVAILADFFNADKDAALCKRLQSLGIRAAVRPTDGKDLNPIEILENQGAEELARAINERVLADSIAILENTIPNIPNNQTDVLARARARVRARVSPDENGVFEENFSESKNGFPDEKISGLGDDDSGKKKFESVDGDSSPSKKIVDIRSKNAPKTRSAPRGSTLKPSPIPKPVKPQSTAEAIENCPINYMIPDGFALDTYGVYFQSTRICSTPIVITKNFTTEGRGGESIELAFYRVTTNRWYRFVVDKGTIADGRKILALAEFGVTITANTSKLLCDFLMNSLDWLGNDKLIPEWRSFNQPGWNAAFTEFHYPTGGADYVVRRAGFNYAEIFAEVGDRKDWILWFTHGMHYFDPPNKMFKAASRAVFGIAVGAPFVHRAGLPNIQTHIVGKSGIGKSALPKLAASVFGRPVTGSLVRTFSGTAKNHLEIAAAFNDFPVVLDELEAVAPSAEPALSKMVYDYSLGVGNQAQRRDGTAREAFHFSGCRISTGERPLVEANSKRGMHKRVLTLELNSLYLDGIAELIHEATERNYGLYGRDWIAYGDAHFSEFMKTFDEVQTEVRSNGFYFDCSYHKLDLDPTNCKALLFGLVMFHAFIDFLLEKGAAVRDDIPLAELYMAAGVIAQALPTARDIDDSPRALAALQSYIHGHISNFVVEEDTSDGSVRDVPAEAYEVFGKIFVNGEVAILPHKLNQIVNELGFASSDKLIRDWNDEGLLRCQAPRLQFKTRISGRAAWTIRFKAGVLIQKS